MMLEGFGFVVMQLIGMRSWSLFRRESMNQRQQDLVKDTALDPWAKESSLLVEWTGRIRRKVYEFDQSVERTTFNKQGRWFVVK